MPGMLQSLNAQAVTYDRLGRYTTAERIYRRALALARARSLERYEVFLQGNLGGSLLAAGNPEAGLRELQAVLAREKSPFLRATRLRQIAEAWRELGQYEKALASPSRNPGAPVRLADLRRPRVVPRHARAAAGAHGRPRSRPSVTSTRPSA